jgi:hypothetical protein
VRMPVHERHVPMPVAMRLVSLVSHMVMLMMLIVRMPVLVLQGFVRMLMLVTFGQMQPQANGHKCAGGQQREKATRR